MEDEARQIAAARLPTEAGEFEARVYETPRGMQPLALVQGELDPEGVILARAAAIAALSSPLRSSTSGARAAC